MAFDRRLKTLGSRCFRLMLFLLSKSDKTILLEITEIVKASLILFLVSLVSQ